MRLITGRTSKMWHFCSCGFQPQFDRQRAPRRVTTRSLLGFMLTKSIRLLEWVPCAAVPVICICHLLFSLTLLLLCVCWVHQMAPHISASLSQSPHVPASGQCRPPCLLLFIVSAHANFLSSATFLWLLNRPGHSHISSRYNMQILLSRLSENYNKELTWPR